MVEKKVSEYSEEIRKMVENMSLMDDDLMSRVFDHNIPATQLLIGTILQKEVQVVDAIGQEEMKNPLVGGRSIRLDVFAKDEKGRHFDCEVQRKQSGAHPKRARFHSAMLDSRMLKEKEEFTSIRDSYVIFITETDYFKQDKPLYFVERKVGDSQPFGDGNHIIYVNGAYEGDDPLGRLMADFRRRDVTDFHYSELEDGVRHFKVDEEGKATMCEAVEKYAKGQYNNGLLEGREEGREVGREVGATQLEQAILRMKEGTSEDVLLEEGFEASIIERARNICASFRAGK